MKKSNNVNLNVQRWLANENFKSFMRQVHMDVYVALKNGVSEREVQFALMQLADEISNSVALNPLLPN